MKNRSNEIRSNEIRIWQELPVVCLIVWAFRRKLNEYPCLDMYYFIIKENNTTHKFLSPKLSLAFQYVNQDIALQFLLSQLGLHLVCLFPFVDAFKG